MIDDSETVSSVRIVGEVDYVYANIFWYVLAR